LFFLASSDVELQAAGMATIGIIRTFIAVYTTKAANICTSYISLKTRGSHVHLSRYIVLLSRSFVRKWGRRIQWNRRRKQI